MEITLEFNSTVPGLKCKPVLNQLRCLKNNGSGLHRIPHVPKLGREKVLLETLINPLRSQLLLRFRCNSQQIAPLLSVQSHLLHIHNFRARSSLSHKSRMGVCLISVQ
jgi:hypothetical protein